MMDTLSNSPQDAEPLNSLLLILSLYSTLSQVILCSMSVAWTRLFSTRAQAISAMRKLLPNLALHGHDSGTYVVSLQATPGVVSSLESKLRALSFEVCRSSRLNSTPCNQLTIDPNGRLIVGIKSCSNGSKTSG